MVLVFFGRPCRRHHLPACLLQSLEAARLSLLDRRLGDSAAAKQQMEEFVRLREGQEKIEQTLKDMHVQLVTQIQRDRNVEASEDVAPK